MAVIIDFAVTIEAATVTSMVMEIPEHETGDLLVACVAKDGAANFNTPAGWDLIQAGTSTGAGGGIYARRATSSSETVTFTLAADTCLGTMVSIRGVYGSTVADAIPTSANAATDSTLPFTGAGLTTGHANSLLIHAWVQDTTAGTSHLPPWINLSAADAAAGGLAVAYSFEPTASTVVTAPDLWGATQDDGRGYMIEVRDGSGGATKPPYIPLDVVPSIQISPLAGVTGVVDRGAYIAAASIAITSVAGKTVTGVAVAATADSGYNPYRGSMRNAGVSSKTNLNHVELDLTATQDVTTGGLVFGTYLHLAPREYIDTGKAVQGGKYIILGSSSANWRAWVIGGQFSKTDTPNARVNFLIEPAFTTTEYASAGTANYAALDYLAFGSSGYYGLPAILWNTLWELRTAIIAGGTATNPFDFDQLVTMVNSGCGDIPVLQQYGALATTWIPLRFGGNENIGIICNLNTFQFPRQADEIDYVDFHCSADKLGIEFYGTGSSDKLHFTNCVFTSPSSYYWRFNASHSASTDINFSGTTVVNATVTLRSTVILDNIAFIGCGEITLNDGDITDAIISNTRAATSQGAVAFTSVAESNGVDRGTFINNNDGDIGHSIRITAVGTYTFDAHAFEGGGPATRSFNTGTGVDSGTDIVTTDAAHGYADGDAIYYQDQGGVVNMGLTDGTLYYINAQSTTTLSFHTTRSAATGDTGRVNLTSSGSETHYIYSAKADVFNNSGGAVTINVTNGGSTPTVRNSDGSSITVQNTVTLEVNNPSSTFVGARVTIFANSGGPESVGTVLMLEVAINDTGVYRATEAYNFLGNQPVTIRARLVGFIPFETTGTITNNGLTVTAIWQVDSIAS